jgi:predicted metal-dependent phosphoesterase TrpH
MHLKDRVNFRYPNFIWLRDSGFTAADMHLHTLYSDGVIRIPSLLKKAKKLGIGLAITDHNEVKGSIKAFYEKKVMIIPGIETTSKEGIHNLFYFYSPHDLHAFYTDHIKNYRQKNKICAIKVGIDDLLDYASKYNGISCAAHPYALAWTGMFKKVHKEYVTADVIEKLDMVEVLSGANFRKRNLLALESAEAMHKPITGGSDAHALMEIGNILTYVKERDNLHKFLDNLRQNRGYVIGKENRMLQRAVSQSQKIRCHIKEPIKTFRKNFSYMQKKEFPRMDKAITPLKNHLDRITGRR